MKVLVVDDDPGYREFLKDAISSQGFDAYAAENAIAAKAMYESEAFDLVISDIVMPEVDGLDLLKDVKLNLPDTDVVLITGFNKDYSFLEMVNLGASDFIEKPFTRDVLIAKVGRIKRERLLKKELFAKSCELAERVKELEGLQGKSKLLEEELRLSNLNLEQKIKDRTKDLAKALLAEERAQQELAAIFKSNPGGIITVDPQMMVVRKNDVNMEFLKVKEGCLLQSSHNNLQKSCFDVLEKTLLSRKGIRDYRVEFVLPKGGITVKLLNSSLLLDHNNEVCGAVLNLHDITRMADLEEKLLERRGFRKFIGACEPIQKVFTLIRQVADVDTTVFISGETGTGKEVVVDTLHACSKFKDRPLVKVNCAALPENLLESELFGHVKGAFTGALSDRRGRIQAAEGGILFLDEIGEISPQIQLRLLRFLEQKEYEKVGDSRTISANVRVVTATNADLERMVSEKKFRKDLFYRLRVFCIDLPPLRDRQLDISLLSDHFMRHFNQSFKKEIKGFSQDVYALFERYSWPGNVRELKHVIEHACLVCNEEYVQLHNLPHRLTEPDIETAKSFVKTSIRSISKEEFLAALEKTDWNKAKTARILDISRSTLYNKIQELDIGN